MKSSEMNINELIVYTARKYIGLQEIKGNLGFKDERFEQLMKEVGWQKGQAWCAYFTELVWKSAYSNYTNKQFVINYNKLLDKLFSAGAVKTYNNFKNSDMFEVNKTPEPGCVVIWQYYKDSKPHWSGHAGIVIKVYSDDSDKFETIEGNTNSQGGREGIEVAKKIRTLDFEPKQRGLVLKGFIHPIV